MEEKAGRNCHEVLCQRAVQSIVRVHILGNFPEVWKLGKEERVTDLQDLLWGLAGLCR